MKYDKFLVFDVESIGLHGEAFAVGWCAVDLAGRELFSGIEACKPYLLYYERDEDYKWVCNNVAISDYNVSTSYAVRESFWAVWKNVKDRGFVLAADVCWPVEARFLGKCIDDDEDRWWEGPYPLIDIASVRLAAGLDPLATVERRPNELPAHNPLADARQSARLLVEALNLCNNFTKE